nr:keratin, type II cytoskeletal 3-like isoform X2 [Setaria viridis]
MADAANEAPPPAPVAAAAAAAAAGGVALTGGVGGGGWTILMPPASAAAEWRVVRLAGAQSAAGTSAAGESSAGGGVPEVALEMAALLAALGAGGDLRVGEGFMVGGGAGQFVAGRGGEGGDPGGRGGEGGDPGGRGGEGGDPGGRGGEGGDPGGRGHAGGPYLMPVPVVFIPNFKQSKEEAEPKEDKGLKIAKLIYGVLLFGPLSFIGPINTVLEAKEIKNTIMWRAFGMCWGLLSIGFHMSFHGGWGRRQRAYVRNIAHFSLTIFCSFVIYYLYLLQPSSLANLQWLISMEALLAMGHIVAWAWVVLAITRVASKEENRDSRCHKMLYPQISQCGQKPGKDAQG